MLNNAIGSVYMLAMQEGWGKAFTDILKNSTLFKLPQEMLGMEKKAVGRAGPRTINELKEARMKDVLYTQGSTSMYGFTDKQLDALGRVDRFFSKIADFNATFADNPARSARVSQLIDEKLQVYKSALRNDGKPVPSDFDIIDKMLNNEKVRLEIAETALEDMIDFQDLSNIERKFIVAYLAPFYSWIKGSTKASIRHIADKPGRVMQHAYLGDEANRQVAEMFPGGLPSYLLGSLPGGWSGENKNAVINLAGASPAQTLADLPGMAGWAVGGIPMQFGSESPAGMLNPFIAGAISGMTHRNLFYGSPYAKSEVFPNILFDTVQPPWYESAYKMGLLPKQPWATGPEAAYVPRKTVGIPDPSDQLQRLFMPYEQEIHRGNARGRYKEELEELGV
jgi:hypothetical protein